MSSSSKLADDILDGIVADIESQGKAVSAELRERLKALAASSAEVASQAILGEDVQEAQRILVARAKTLEAVGVIGAARIAADATRRAVFGALKVAIEALA